MTDEEKWTEEFEEVWKDQTIDQWYADAIPGIKNINLWYWLESRRTFVDQIKGEKDEL